ncbi:thioredoxin domain-containing protein [Dehalogenimonas sp. THU2]|uniref:thioredoxin domain-containing protein n=1 Tax=Dehalogenimonas sp. THU2 TaxID=3151121 RepID=UPI00321850E7
MTNHLAGQTSPYLLQHAENPVEWYPWGEEALARARTENKPILLSIGYSACHWCHVMAHESFENPETAGLMNRNFINIKVDREERPDLDAIYMSAVQALTGHGGWPLTAFLTPDGKPFYGGTYFPPEDGHGLPAFSRVLEAIADTFRTRPTEVAKTAKALVTALSEAVPAGGGTELSADIMERAYGALQRDFDKSNGGFGGAPKFPQPLVLDFLLRYFHRSKDRHALETVEITLEKMYRGGMYDHLGGGFHRYATDNAWQVPHFEKMLYDNALLSRVYLHAFQITGNPEYRAVAEDIFEYVLREMTDASSGGFYSAQDADSEGEEGKYYTWDGGEIDSILGEARGETFRKRFGVTAGGNFEGMNILHLTGEFTAEAIGRDREPKSALLRRREQRVPPGKDTKVLASWNGMMVASLAEASCVLGRPDYLAAAVRSADNVLNSLVKDGSLRHTSSVEEGFLEDYAQMIDAMLWLHQVTLSSRWLSQALQIADRMIALFWNDSEGVFYDVPMGTPGLFKLPRSVQDGAVPSGSSAATAVLLKLARVTDNQKYLSAAERSLRGLGENMARYPLGFGHHLSALDLYLGPSQEVAIIGAPDDPAVLALVGVVCGGFRPNTITVGLNPGEESAVSGLAIFKDRSQVDGRATAYVCREFNCFPPVTTVEGLGEVLERVG